MVIAGGDIFRRSKSFLVLYFHRVVPFSKQTTLLQETQTLTGQNIFNV
jgi:hypothetical protein